jgi:hypothetical protein
MAAAKLAKRFAAFDPRLELACGGVSVGRKFMVRY